MFANRAGRFQAEVLDKSIAETGQNNLATLVMRFGLQTELIEGEFADISAEQLELTGYFYLEKKDGSTNDFAIDKLKQTFGWDGLDPFWFEDNELAMCQLTLDFETWEGKEKLKVKFIDPVDSTGGGAGFPTPDAGLRKSLGARLGSKLRALSGGQSRPAPAKPSGAPAAPPKKGPPSKPAGKPSGKPSTETEVWDEYDAFCTENSVEDGENRWFEIVQTITSKDDPAAVTPDEWGDVSANFKDVLDGTYIPF